MKKPQKIPVTILTGFLGAGKTTLLNRLLTEQHGRRIAVIENEFGAVGIDHDLVINADEEIFEMSNGCICCTVRGDLIRILSRLAKRRDRFDYVLVETTGLADPGPVAQTFFMDDEVREDFALDGIVTVVDAKHLDQQLGRSKECEEQIAFADVVLLNKIDLAESRQLDEIDQRIRAINRMARIYRSVGANVPVDAVLSLGAFDLQSTLERRPDFLEPEYPFEWSGVYALEAGSHLLCIDDGPDDTLKIAALRDVAPDSSALQEAAERCVRLFAEPPIHIAPDGKLPLDACVELKVNASGVKTFVLELDAPARIALFSQHQAWEYALHLLHEGRPVAPLTERDWVGEHEHDDTVTSVCIQAYGDLEEERFNRWLSALLRDSGPDIFRMKGFLSVADSPDRFVFQGVHMLFDGAADRPWGDDPRENKLVFIGRHLDADAIEQGFRACLR
jgi:G3E family GTPase